MTLRLYFSYGLPKSGSSLAFRLTRRFFKRNRRNQPKAPAELLGHDGPQNYIVEPTPERVEGLLKFAESRRTCLVLKTHAAPNEAVASLLRERRVAAHAVYRDPREVVLSLMDAGARNRARGRVAFANVHDLEDAIAFLEPQIASLERWLKLPTVFPAFYDDFVWSLTPLVQRLQRQTGLRRASQEDVLEGFNEKAGLGFNKAAPARWRAELPEEDADRIRSKFRAVFDNLIDDRRVLGESLFHRLMRGRLQPPAALPPTVSLGAS
ncbi:MAG: hypothetical protein AAF401_09180 [Pseudomonadota bacterium]